MRFGIGAHWICHGVLDQQVPDFGFLRPINTIKGMGKGTGDRIANFSFLPGKDIKKNDYLLYHFVKRVF